MPFLKLFKRIQNQHQLRFCDTQIEFVLLLSFETKRARNGAKNRTMAFVNERVLSGTEVDESRKEVGYIHERGAYSLVSTVHTTSQSESSLHYPATP